MNVAIVNLGCIVTGDWRRPTAQGDGILMRGERIAAVGTLAAGDVEAADVVIDAGGATAMPGLIDSQVHVTFGDYRRRSAISTATCMAASRPPSARPRFMCRGDPRIRKGSRPWPSRR